MVSLLKALCALDGDFWIRPMYLYPDTFDRGVLELCQADPRILPYFDIPFQHASQRILQKMGRAGSPAAGHRLGCRRPQSTRLPG